MSINDFIDYVTRFDRDFPSRIRGGSPQEVQRFADLALELTGKQVPESVRDYMLSMGLGDGGLRPPTDYPEMNLHLLIELYQDIKKDDAADDSFAEDCIIIGYEGVTLPDMSVEVLEGSDAPPRVVATSGAELKHEVAESLENHLYQRAFSKYRVEPLPAFFGFYPRDRSAHLDAFAKAAAAVGIRAEPFSDRDVFCGTSGTVFAAFYQAYRAFPYAVFASADAHELDRVTFAFQRQIPMDRIAPKP